MTLDKIIEIANKAYPDDWIQQYYEDPKLEYGDSLARFIMNEICETYDESCTDEQQIAEAIRVVQRAADEVQAVAYALERAEMELAQHGCVAK